MRTIRAGIEMLLQPMHRATVDAVSRHSMRRIVYGALLAVNALDYLSNASAPPRYCFGDADAEDATNAIIDFWMSRWLAMRIDYGPAIARIQEVTRESVLLSNASTTESIVQ